MQLLSGKWKGSFTYGDSYPENLKGKAVGFLIELEEKDGYFKGFCRDDHSLFEQPATISGFVDDDFISFVKKYPCFWGTDEEGNSYIDELKPAHDVHYAGTLDQLVIEGDFEFGNLASFVHSDEIYEGGLFTMHKED